MTNDEIQEKINQLSSKKKKLDGSRTLCAFLFCIFLFDWDKFMAGDPSKLLIGIFAVITVVPVGLIIYETKLIQGLKKEIAELTSKLAIEDSEDDEEETSEEDGE
ncbi:hypothetical protein [Treponema sp. C6A8]|uniref:hypothetical protein n=1 Tax=Treponema sp. C6A8 TaxID=1410609 RepID=UPI0004882389|nr:hypothetical protein [Treponema sp. C6A8]